MSASSIGAHAEAEESATERSAFRKVGARLVPLALLAFFITYIDRANLGITASGMEKSLHISPVSFGLAAGLFYVGYLVMEIPSNILLEKFGARRWIARIIVSFGALSLATAFVRGESSLVSVRVLLGIAEGGMYPGLVLYLGYWFNQRRRAANLLLFQISLPLSLAVGALLSSALLNLDGLGGLAGWQWVFLVEGTLTILVGLLIFVGLPDRPKDAKWLTGDERDALAHAAEADGAREIHGWAAIAAVSKSPVSWFLTGLYFCTLAGFLSLNYWAPTIINHRFHLSPVGAGLLSSVPWVVCTLSLVLAASLSKRIGRPALFILVSMVICGIGMFVASEASSPVVAFVGLCLATCQQAAAPMVFTLARDHFPVPLLAVAFALINAVANLAGLVGPVILGWLVEATGSTEKGLIALSAFFWLAAILAVFAPRFIRRQERLRPWAAPAPAAPATPAG